MFKKIICLFISIITLFNFISISTFAANFNIDFVPSCEALYLYNLDTNTVAYDKNGNKKMFPASLTKIMTYVITAEHVKDFDNTKITVKKELMDSLLGTGSSVSGIKVNDVLTVTQLLHCLMIKSGNDAALVLADYVGEGSVNKFVDMMNDKANEIGCYGTHFSNPHGFHDDNNYTTAADIIIMTKYAMELPHFMEICSSPTSYIMGQDKYPLVTTNSMIDQSRGGKYYYQYARGIKTGHMDQSGYCLVSSAVYNGYSYLCAALGAPIKDTAGNKIFDNYAMLDSKAIYKWAFTNLELKLILKKSEPLSEIKLNLTTNKDTTLLHPADNYSALLPKSVSPTSIDIKIEKPESIDAPIKTGQKIGTALLSYANKELARIDLVSAEDVDRNVVLYAIQCITDIITSIWFKIAVVVAVIFSAFYLFLCVSYNKKARRKRTKIRKHYK